MPYLIGLDAGSSIIKAACFDLNGKTIAVVSKRTPLQRYDDGRVEADPNFCWQTTCNVLREILEHPELKKEKLIGLGITAAMVGLWLLDENGDAIRNGINWEDNRSKKILAKHTIKNPNFMEDIFSVSGSVMQQGCTLPLIAALQAEEPKIIEKAHAFVSYKDFLRAKLTGNIAIDKTEAAVAPGDAVKQTTSKAMHDFFKLDNLATKFPQVLDSCDLAGTITAQAAQQTGLPKGLPVAVGAGDVPASVIGAGGCMANAVTAVLGTTCMVGRISNYPIFTPKNLGLLFSLPEKLWFRAMVNVAGTLNLDWVMNLTTPELVETSDGFDKLTQKISNVPIGANGVSYLPYLSQSGIVAPIMLPDARAQFCGLAPNHNRWDLIRAVMEGVAFSMSDLTEQLDVDQNASIRLVGGGSRNHVWCDIIANALNRKIVIPEGDEFGARGAAILAGIATGIFSNLEAATDKMSNKFAREYYPTESQQEKWLLAKNSYAKYRDNLLSSACSV